MLENAFVLFKDSFPGVSVHVSNAAPKSDTRGNSYRDGRGGGGHGPGRGGGPNGPDGPGMYNQRYNGPGPNQGSWGNQGGPRGNIDMPNLQALGEWLYNVFISIDVFDTEKTSKTSIEKNCSYSTFFLSNLKTNPD